MPSSLLPGNLERGRRRKAEAACPHSGWVELTWHWVLILQAFGQGGGRDISAMVSLCIPQPDPVPCEAPIPLASILPSAPQLHWLTTGPWCELTILELRPELPGWLGVS